MADNAFLKGCVSSAKGLAGPLADSQRAIDPNKMQAGAWGPAFFCRTAQKQSPVQAATLPMRRVMTTVTGLTLSRKASMPTLPASDVVIATAWLVLYAVILGITVSSEALSSAIEIAALH
jgi:hypothetical protein